MNFPIRYNSPVTLTFALLCVGVAAVCHLIPSIRTNFFVLCSNSWSVTNPLDYFRIFSSTVGHADWSHLMGNMSIFLLIAPIVEEKYGGRQVAMMMFFTSLVTGAIQILFMHQCSLGASGLVFMFIILVSFADARKGSIPLTFVLVTVFYLGREFISAFDANRVSEYAHIMGGAFGGLFGFFMRPVPKIADSVA